MTATVNSSPLATLLSSAAPTQSGGAPLSTTSSQGLVQTGSGNSFFNILQLVNVQTSGENGAATPTLPALFSPSEQAAPWIAQARPSGLGVGPKITPEQRVTTPLLTDGKALEVLDGVSAENLDAAVPGGLAAFLLKNKNHIKHEVMEDSSSNILSLAVPFPVDQPAGIDAPLGGKALPSSVGTSATQRSISSGSLELPLTDTDALPSLEEHSKALMLKREAPMPALTPLQYDRMPMPELAAPVVKMLSPQNGGQLIQPPATLSLDLSSAQVDVDTQAVDLNRAQPSVTTDRSNPIQQTVTTLTLPRPAGAPGWDQGLGQRILWMVDNGLNQAELRLDPPNLGSVSIRISMLDDQAQLQFQAAHPGAREALESALPKLREMFNHQGLELADADVSDQQAHSEENADTESGELKAQWESDVDKAADDAASMTSGRSSITESGTVLIDEFV